MKKFNKNILLFVVVCVFIVIGLSTDTMKDSLKEYTRALFSREISFSSYVDAVEDASSKQLKYHSTLVDINSFYKRITGTRVVVKDDYTVVRADNDYLAYTHEYVSDETIDAYTESVKNVYNKATESGSEFLYVMCPEKGYAFNYPIGTDNYSKDNCDRFSQSMSQKGIPILNLRDEMTKEGRTDEETFFVTDHHWTPNSAFWGYTKVCEELQSKYSFQYDSYYTDLSNYNVETYEDWFLGSQGKKAGKCFTRLGVDSIDLITPKFETSLIEEQPVKNEYKQGDFSSTVMCLEHINEKDYYSKNPYAAYSGGDFRLQIITNNLNKDGKTFLVIRDSYACAFTPFLSLTAGKVYICDIRDFDYFVGEKVSVSNMISEIKPDYVLIVYNGVPSQSTEHGCFNFD